MKIDAFAPMRSGEHPEQESEGDSSELHQKDGGDQRALVDAELGAVACREPLDCADAVGVDDEGDQKQKRVSIAPQFANGVQQSGERCRASVRRPIGRRGRRASSAPGPAGTKELRTETTTPRRLRTTGATPVPRHASQTSPETGSMRRSVRAERRRPDIRGHNLPLTLDRFRLRAQYEAGANRRT